jgi:hypothetical protein
MVIVVVLGIIAGEVFHLIVIVPVAVDGPRIAAQSFVEVVSVPDTAPLMTVIGGFPPSGVAKQPLSVPLILAVSGDAPPLRRPGAKLNLFFAKVSQDRV